MLVCCYKRSWENRRDWDKWLRVGDECLSPLTPLIMQIGESAEWRQKKGGGYVIGVQEGGALAERDELGTKKKEKRKRTE